MAPADGSLASSRLRQMARRAPAGKEGSPTGEERSRIGDPASTGPGSQRCELCGARIGAEHRHLLDLSTRELMCACQACKILFDRPAAGGDHYRLVPDRRLRLEDFELDDVTWAELRIPVEMAFFFHSTPAERVVAFYPGPMGATESLLELDAWQQLERANPVLRSMEPDVEALLVNRARGASDHYLVPIDDSYNLVGLIRTQWRGMTGGEEVWEEIAAFFARLATRAKTTTSKPEEDTWRRSEPANTM